MWCYWRESTWYRRDHACVHRPHGPDGEPTRNYWLASPPWIPTIEEDRALARRRFSSPLAAVEFADKAWPLATS